LLIEKQEIGHKNKCHRKKIKKLPDLVYKLVEQLVQSGDKNSYRIAYRACKNLVKKESGK